MKAEEKSWRKNYFLFKWKYKLLFLCFGFLGFASCQTLFQKKTFIPSNLSEYKDGAFSGIVSIHQRNRKHRFNGDIFISEDGKLRMDLSVSPGLSVFTLLFDKEEITILFLRKREFYKGRNISLILPALFSKFPGFAVFREIFFERLPKGDKWVCKTNKKNEPVECQNPLWLVRWERGKKRLFSIGSSEFTFVFQYFSFSSGIDEKVFAIKIPENFKPISLLK